MFRTGDGKAASEGKAPRGVVACTAGFVVRCGLRGKKALHRMSIFDAFQAACVDIYFNKIAMQGQNPVVDML